MPGFLYYKLDENEKKYIFSNKKNNLSREMTYKNINICQETINKFLEDKVFLEDDKYIVVIEGVIVNSKELINNYSCENWLDTIIYMYNKVGESFFSEFRGSFSGIFIDKNIDKRIIYTNQIGDKEVFFLEYENQIIVASEVNYILDICKKKNIKLSINKNAVYSLLTYGYQIEDNTMFKEIKKLNAGNYLVIENELSSIKPYYILDNKVEQNKSLDLIIDELDSLFRKAIKRAFDKDEEYGYDHLVGLSGGLDSRMTTWVAKELGYKMTNYTFSQSDYLDETIAKRIASDLKNEWIFKFLDNGNFIYNIDEITKINPGGALFYGLAHSKSCMDLLNLDKFGIVHTGQLGDVVLGTFFSSLDENKPYSISDGAYSRTLLSKLSKDFIKNSYKNEEIFKFYARCFTGANQGLLVIQQNNESYSPFCDVDFMNYCLKIPLKYRYNHYIYKLWMIKKYPKSTKYKWEKTNSKVTEKNIKILNREIPLKQLIPFFIKVLNRKLFKKTELHTKKHMNPLDFWYNDNKDLKNFMDLYFEKNIKRLENYKDIQKDCSWLYKEGSCIEKVQVLSVLSFLKNYSIYL